MPKEVERTTAKKRVKLPSGDVVEVPVITEIRFIDASDRYQEIRTTIDNSEESNRTVHVDEVFHTDVDEDGRAESENPSQDTSEGLFVERIDQWPVLDASDRHQETRTTFDNTTGFDSKPPSFTEHQTTHVYRYYEDPDDPDDDGAWIDSELIDEFRFEDGSDRHQETRYILTNPFNEETRSGDPWGQAQADDPDITIVVGEDEGEGTEENPVRLDPFQNIVNYSGGGGLMLRSQTHIGESGGGEFIQLYGFSSDAKTWQTVNLDNLFLQVGAFGGIIGFTRAGGGWKGVGRIGETGTSFNIYTSGNGIDWSLFSGPISIGTFAAGSGQPNFCYGKPATGIYADTGLYLLSGFSDVSAGLAQILASRDAITWFDFGRHGIDQIYSVSFTGNKFFICGNITTLGGDPENPSAIGSSQISVSDDGVSWIQNIALFNGIPFPSPNYGRTVFNVTYKPPQNEGEQGIYAANGVVAQLGPPGSFFKAAVAVSSNGLSWSGGVVLPTVGTPSRITSNSQRFAMGGGEFRNDADVSGEIPCIYTSIDGVSWTKTFQRPELGNFPTIDVTKDTFAAGGTSSGPPEGGSWIGELWWSEDGLTWTSAEANDFAVPMGQVFLISKGK